MHTVGRQDFFLPVVPANSSLPNEVTNCINLLEAILIEFYFVHFLPKFHSCWSKNKFAVCRLVTWCGHMVLTQNWPSVTTIFDQVTISAHSRQLSVTFHLFLCLLLISVPTKELLYREMTLLICLLAGSH